MRRHNIKVSFIYLSRKKRDLRKKYTAYKMCPAFSLTTLMNKYLTNVDCANI